MPSHAVFYISGSLNISYKTINRCLSILKTETFLRLNMGQEQTVYKEIM